jgi:hypothetical protein
VYARAHTHTSNNALRVRFHGNQTLLHSGVSSYGMFTWKAECVIGRVTSNSRQLISISSVWMTSPYELLVCKAGVRRHANLLLPLSLLHCFVPHQLMYWLLYPPVSMKRHLMCVDEGG